MAERLLIAEDSRRLNRKYEKILKEKGYEVLTAFDGEQAMDLLKKEKIDLLLLDLQMPKMDGVEVLRQIKYDAQFAALKVLVVTGVFDWREGPFDSMRVQAAKIGAADFAWLKGRFDQMDKPIFPSLVTKKFREQLLAKVEKILKTKEDDWRKGISE